jgi:hypothetical protein
MRRRASSTSLAFAVISSGHRSEQRLEVAGSPFW